MSPLPEPENLEGQGRGAALIVLGRGCRATPEGPTPKLRAIADALIAYPWTRDHLVTWTADVPAYCALGAMLRAAGIARPEIARADNVDAHSFWEGWGPLLYTEYGIPGLASAHRIVALNDAAQSQAEAAGLILIRLSTSCDMARLLPPDQLEQFDGHGVMLSLEGIFLYNGWDLVGPPSPLRPSRWLPGDFSSPAWRPKPWRPKPKPWRPRTKRWRPS